MSGHDLIVIGLGPGGEEVAQRAAEAGLASWASTGAWSAASARTGDASPRR